MSQPEPCLSPSGCRFAMCAYYHYCTQRRIEFNRLNKHITPSQECSWRIDAAIAHAKANASRAPSLQAALVDAILARPEEDQGDVLGCLAHQLVDEWKRDAQKAEARREAMARR